MEHKIFTLLNTESGILKINKYCYLHRWTKSMTVNKATRCALVETVDRLEVVFSLIRPDFYKKDIHSREWTGIIAEIQIAQEEAFANAYEELTEQLLNDCN